ncbi:hypothetical protein M5D96_005179 [Drosophila gunungcola]|uniref:Uncharacterized protein n=1 Tax=Drosophila gunungcola TaxID=103775 RepID=A0A9P9YVG9_9MUSC|nr:hypothetical protein M5D96_005179 [Drosophila gunungcola]
MCERNTRIISARKRNLRKPKVMKSFLLIPAKQVYL